MTRRKRPLVISLQTNVTALVADNNVQADGASESTAITRLTSGYRINSSGDDAAGLAVANKYRSDAAELNQGIHNANDGISQLQIADGGLNNISNILDRMKTLATQSASDSFTGDRSILQGEYLQLLTEIDRQAANINLNTGGAFVNTLSVYIGGGPSPVVTIDLSNASVDTTALGVAGGDISTAAGGVAAIAAIETAISKLGAAQGAVGTGENDLSYAVQLANSQATSFSAANSRIRDADAATEASNLTRSQALLQASVAAMAQLLLKLLQ
jgi:flagellin